MKIRREGLSWWVLPKNSDWLKKEIIPTIFQTKEISGLHPVKKTDTRLVFRCNLKNSEKSLIVKVFKRSHLGNKLKSFFRPSRSWKEWQIGHKLSERSISTPPLVASGSSRKFGFLRKDYIISEEITEAKPLNIWIEENIHQRSISLSEKKRVIQAFALFVRLIHDQGIYPSDFHQGNVLIKIEKTSPPIFYLIDLHSIRIKRKLTLQNRIKNLVQLNDFRISMPDRFRFLKSYLPEEMIKGISTKKLARKIKAASLKDWQHLWTKRKRKCLQSKKMAEKLKIDSWVGMVKKDYVFSQTLKKIKCNFQGSGVKDIKKTPLVSVKELTLPRDNKSRCLIIKEYKAIGWSSKVKAMFRISRAKRAWVNAHNLLMRGISTPAPVAYGEKKRWGMVWESFFITEKVSESQASDLFLKSPSKKSSLKKNFLVNLARLVRWMHQTNICHGDLKASNILVASDGKNPRIFLVDMDGVKIRPTIGIKDIARDLSRMRAAFSDILSQSELEYFLRIYGKDNRFFQTHEKKIMKKVHKLTAKKILQKQKV
ncbi:MAG: hypothetical protein J7M06_01325 [Proteobacteria bacterium]|nr:hypothetical protein [Pseudomonadota bacterium]